MTLPSRNDTRDAGPAQLVTNSPTIIVPPGGGEEYRILNGRTLIKIAREQATAGAFSMVEQMLPPNGGPLTHVHGNEDEGFYVLEGTVVFYFADGPPVEAAAGTYLHSPRGALHTWRNESRAPARMLGFFFPGGFEGYFREVGNPAGYTGPEMTLDEFKRRSVSSGTRYGIRYFFPGEVTAGSAGGNHISRPGEGESLYIVRNHVTIKAGKEQTGGRYVLGEESIPPGAEMPMHHHQNEDEAAYILSGELTWLMPDGSPVRLAAGGTLFSPKGTPHAWRNDTDEVARLVFVAAPSGMESAGNA